jgi:hypothetical protein
MWTDPGLLLFYKQPNKKLPEGLEFLNVPVAVIPATKSQAQALAKWANKSREERIEAIAETIAGTSGTNMSDWDVARSVLALMEGQP